MLSVETKLGERISVLDYSKNELEEMRRRTFYCPGCHHAVRLKNGPILSAHFAHISGEICQSFSEGETEEHLKGKKLIAEWCERSSIPYELEAYLPELKQRPDVLINEKLAIEFQCSPLSLERFKERTEGYLVNGYEVIWVLGSHYFLEERLSTLQKAALTYREKIGLVLWQLDVRRQELLCHYGIQRQLITGALYYQKEVFGLEKVPLQSVLKSMANLSKINYYLVSKSDLNYVRLELIRKLVQKDARLLKIQQACYRDSFLLQTLTDDYFSPLVSSIVIGDEVLYLKGISDGVFNKSVWQECIVNRPELLKKLEAFPSLVLRDLNETYDYLEF